MSGTPFIPGGPTYAITVPYLRTSPVRMPRRDIVLGGSDSFYLRVFVVESDDPSAPPLAITGGLGGPSMQMVVWPETYYRGWWDYSAGWWDYGALLYRPPPPIWAGQGTPVAGIGAFDFTFPSGTMMSWPRRSNWCVQLDYSNQGAEILMAGKLHVSRMGAAAFQVVTGGLLTDDRIPVHTDIDEQVYT